MHSNSRVSPLRTILVLVVPTGYMKMGSWSPFALSEENKETRTSETESFSYTTKNQLW